MSVPGRSPEEELRLEALAKYAILDTPAETDFDDLTALAAQICGAPMAAISIVDDSRVWFKSRIGVTVTELPREIAFCDHSIILREQVIVPDASADSRFAGNPLVTGDTHVRFYAGSPLFSSEGQPIGAICVLDVAPRNFTPDQCVALTRLSRMAMSLLELRRKSIELQRANLQLDQRQQALRESEHLLRLVIDLVPHHVFAKDRGGRYLFVNISAARSCGKQPAEMVGKTDRELRPGSPFVEGYLNDDIEVIDNNTPKFIPEEKIGFPGDEIRLLQTIKMPFIPPGATQRAVLGVAIDITERKRADDDRDKLMQLIERSPDFIGLADLEGRLTFLNLGGRKLIGLGESDDVSRLHFTDYVPAPWLSLFRDTVIPTAFEKGLWEGEMQLRNLATGEMVDVWRSTFVIRDPEGVPRFFATVTRDIGAQKTAELAAGRLASIVTYSDDAIISKNLDSVITSWNKGAEKLFGFTADEMIGASIQTIIPPDRQAEEGMILDKIRRGESLEHFETQRRTRDERLIDVSITASPIKDASGKIVGVSKIARDITAHIRAEQRIRQLNRVFSVLSDINQTIVREKNVQALLESACRIAVEKGAYRMCWIGLIDAQAQILKPVASAGHVEGYLDKLRFDLRDESRPLGPTSLAIISEDHSVCTDIERDPVFAPWREEAIKRGYRSSGSFPVKVNGKTIGTFNLYSDKVGFFDEEEIRLLDELAVDIGFALEISQREAERTKTVEALRVSEAQFRSYFEMPLQGIAVTSTQKRWTRVNDRACAILGYSREELLQLTWEEITHEHDLPENERLFQSVIAGDIDRYEMEKRFIRKGGQLIWISLAVGCVRNPDRSVSHLVAVISDISKRKEAEFQLKGALIEAQRFREALDHVPSFIYMKDINSRYVYANRPTLKLFGCSADQLPGSDDTRFFPPNVVDRLRRADQRTFSGEKTAEETIVHGHDTRPRYFWEVKAPIYQEHAGGKCVWGLLGISTDITESKFAEAALRESEERFRQIAENIDEVFWILDPSDGKILYVSPAFERIWGISSSALYANPNAWIEAVHCDDRAAIKKAFHPPSLESFNETYRIVRPDNSVRWINDRAFPLRDSNGKIFRVIGTAADITANKTLEDQFRQSQKMEAFGLLAGGVAHDFNNLLSVIIGYCDMWIVKFPADAPILKPLSAIKNAGERAAALTRQLLAFSRQTVLESKIVDLNSIVHDTNKLLGRLIGEDIQVHVDLDPAIPLVKVDPGQIGQVLINLAVNARDAMPKGGILTIQTRTAFFDAEYVQAHPGPKIGSQAMLSVGDTGHGIAPEILGRIFEPFFTTKGVGKGTGLGLAVVHGIVTQSGGSIEVDTKVGSGTTFKLFFPRTGETIPSGRRSEDLVTQAGIETILVVEDEENLRVLAAESLGSMGYEVLTASSGHEALEIADKSGGVINLLLTDVIMPAMSGRELADMLLSKLPALKVLFMSGYTDDSVMRHGIDQEKVAFLQKPFTPYELLKKIRTILDAT